MAKGEDQRRRLSLDIAEFKEELERLAKKSRRNLTQMALLAVEKGIKELQKEID